MKRIFSIGLVVITSSVFANENVSPEKSSGVYCGFECGASISTNILFAPDWNLMGVTKHSWEPVRSDSFETNFGTHKCLGAKIGYQFNPTIGIEAAYNYRGKFDSIRGYAQTTDALHGEIFSINCISFQTVMFNLNLLPEVSWGGFVPYVTSGIGVAINKTGELRNYDVFNQSVPISFDTRLRGKTCKSFAWQTGVGVHYTFFQKWRFELGYRYVDVGKLMTSDSFVGVISGYTSTLPPFVAKHPAFNEIIASLVYCF